MICVLFSPPDIPEHLTSSNEFHRVHPTDSNTKLSSNTFIDDDDPNGSFEDEENDDEHSQPVDHPNGQTPQGTIIKAHALYDFTGINNRNFFFIRKRSCMYLGHGSNGCQYVNAVTIHVGECIDILEDDQGDGWTRIQKPDGSTGFVPSSYLRIDSPKLPNSSQKIDSGRF